MKSILKKIFPHALAVAIFYVLSIVYFSPAVFDNKTLPQADVKSSTAWGSDLKEYHNQTGDYAFWSNSMFSGMPANYTYMPPTNNVFKIFGKILTLNASLNYGLLFLYMIGFYIFVLAIGGKPWLGIVGAVAYGFCTYNLVIIEAGHINKGLVMATMAPILGGIMLTYRKK
ncbi:MAG: hypothetical protein LBV75_04885, partial [Paludibacter sp.]|nr:hypothetical protein [Paludibacter sp.]